MDITITIYLLLIGACIGILMTIIFLVLFIPRVGVLNIDTSDDVKDVFRFEFSTPPEDIKRKIVILRVNRK